MLKIKVPIEEAQPEDPSEEESNDETPYKMVLAIRSDLKMQKGKAAAQCCHATLGAYKKAVKNDSKAVQRWSRGGQAKITVQVPNEEEMDNIALQAKAANLITYTVADAGRTQVAPGSRTVLAIGPGPVASIDKITKHLKLY
uniref:peptidyl-tRNA hydrolase n=1 Tax=Arcella intermedia TaxID=1963864 RepID=A0A6B2LQR2_9EUKA